MIFKDKIFPLGLIKHFYYSPYASRTPMEDNDSLINVFQVYVHWEHKIELFQLFFVVDTRTVTNISTVF